jgi:hypothetical protein
MAPQNCLSCIALSAGSIFLRLFAVSRFLSGWPRRAVGKEMVYDPELESFKTGIDLRVYAASRGYQLSVRDSWRGSAVMRHPNGDKIIIKLGIDAHYIYFSVRDDRDNGTIIDFLQNRDRQLTLGSIRKELRPWLGPPTRSLPLFAPLVKTSKNRLKVEAAFAGTEEARRHAYLEDERAIPVALLESGRFIGRIRKDARGNAVFPHFDAGGLCGFELKNAGFTGFAAGGTKGLWLSHAIPEDWRLVVCESAIDALSHAALFADERTRYASLGGKPNPAQTELIRAAATRMPAGAQIVAAFDADSTGRELAELVRRAVELTGRADLGFEIHEPHGVKDWNDQLRRKGQAPLPSRTGEPPVA